MIKAGKFYKRLGFPEGDTFPVYPSGSSGDVFYRTDHDLPYYYHASSGWVTFNPQDGIEVAEAGVRVGTEKQINFIEGTNVTITLADDVGNERVDITIAASGTSGSGTGVTVHGDLTGLDADDHSQYALLAGRSGGQVLYGGVDAGDDLILESTDNGTKGYVLLNPNGGDVAVGAATPKGTFYILTAAAGSYTPNTNADDLVVEDVGNTGVSIISGEGFTGSLYYGTPTNPAWAGVVYEHDNDLLGFIVAGVVDFNMGVNSFNILAGSAIVMADDTTIGQAAGPLLTFDDSNNYLEITGCNVGITQAAPPALLSVGSGTGVAAWFDAAGEDGVLIDPQVNNARLVIVGDVSAEFMLYDDNATADIGLFRIINADDLVKLQIVNDAFTAVQQEVMMFDNATGYVGIGAAPSALFDVTGSDPSIYLTNSDAANVANTAVLDFRLNSDAAERSYFRITTTSQIILDGTRKSLVQFNTNDAGAWGSRLAIWGSNVGIGTNSPARELHVLDTTANAYIRVETDAVNGTAGYEMLNDAQQWSIAVNASDQLQIRDDTGPANVIIIEPGAPATLRIDSDGNVSIGSVTATANLHVLSTDSKAQKWQRGTNIWGWEQGGNGSGIGLYDYVNTRFAFWAAPNGRLGVGAAVTNPLATLHVDQSSTTAAIPTLILDQADVSEGTINFIASARGVVAGLEASIQSVRVELNGTVYRLALYANL